MITKEALDFQTNPPQQHFLKCNYRAMLRIIMHTDVRVKELTL